MQSLPPVVPINVGMACPMPFQRSPKLLGDCIQVAPPCMPQFQELCRQYFLNPVHGCAAQTFVELLRNHFLVLKQVIDLTYAIYAHLQLASISLPNAHQIHAQLYDRFCCERKALFNQNLLQSAFDGVCLLRGRGYNQMFLKKWVDAIMSISYFLVKHTEARLWQQKDLSGELANQIEMALKSMVGAIPNLAGVAQFSDSIAQYFRNIAQYIEYFSRPGGQLNSCATIIQNGVNLADAAGSLIDTIITQGFVAPLPQPPPSIQQGPIDLPRAPPKKIASVREDDTFESTPAEQIIEERTPDEIVQSDVAKEAVAEVEKSAMRFQAKSASRKTTSSAATRAYATSSLSKANFSSMK